LPMLAIFVGSGSRLFKLRLRSCGRRRFLETTNSDHGELAGSSLTKIELFSFLQASSDISDLM
jgi:hypothetical protein